MRQSFFLASAASRMPSPADPELAALGLARWSDVAADLPDQSSARGARELAASPEGRVILEALFGNSPFLTDSCLKEPAFFQDLLMNGPEDTFAELMRALNRELALGPNGAPGPDRATVMRILRISRRRASLVIALADIAGAWDLEKVTEALSGFAEMAIGYATRHLLAAAGAAGELELSEPTAPERFSGLIVLGMGKLGARELNYSSDIDLVLLFDTEKARYTGKRTVQQLFAQLARDLVQMLSERTADGYVFRTDLRLRPDPASTPPALSVLAALTYYESTGQNWERAAFIKARPVAGDRLAGAAFLSDLTPFLWRKNLDFAAIEDIHSIKRQINAHRGGGRIALLGHNVKLGRGGIREVEFFAQTQQLIWGGRMPELRLSATCATLAALAETKRITPKVAQELTEAYSFLRRVEHRLQMVDDQQTHTLPTDEAAFARIATFLGFPTRGAFAQRILETLATVERRYGELFEEAPTLSGPGNLVFTGTDDDPETLATLATLGFADPPTVSATVRGWHHGRYRATRSQRARELLTELVPMLLKELGATAHPDTALIRFDQFLGRLPAGVQLLSLFHANPGLLALVAEIMGAVPRLADELARRPILLDGVLTEGFFDLLPNRETLAADLERALSAARHYEEILDLSRRWTNDRKFQIGVQLLRQRIDGDQAGAAFADVAETVIATLLPRVEEEFARSHGKIEGGGLAVFGLGKLGGREMSVVSDLDLILIYDAPEAVEVSDGARPLAIPTYYTRLSHRLINALTALTQEGNLYEVDMRLRPSGSAGPTASSLEAFRRYHSELAWTWEHMALTRARAIAGPASLQARGMAAIHEVVTRPRGPDLLLRDVADMRLRMAEAHRAPPFWDVKHLRGGMVDVEFIAQYLILREAARLPHVIAANTSAALEKLGAGGVLDPKTAEALGDAMRLWRGVQGFLKLTLDGAALDEEAPPHGLRQALAQCAGAVDFEALKTAMMATAARVRAIYAALIETPAATARLRLPAD